MPASSHLSAIAKLEGLKDSNWEEWKYKTRAMFQLAGLMKWLDGEAKEPKPKDPGNVLAAEQTVMDEFQEWEEETKALLVLAIHTPSELAHTYGAATAADMWNQLCWVKEPKGIHGIVDAYQMIFWTYANDGDSITNHISKMHSHRNTLNTLGSPIPDNMFAILVLASLPDSWTPLQGPTLGTKDK
jgi:hypothetical protein